MVEELSRDLGLLEALTLGAGTMIGGGVYVLVGVAARQAGPAAIVSYVFGGVIALLTALSLAELATGMPRAGGSYYYVTHTLGPMFGSIVGIGMWSGRIFASAFYLIGFGQYLTYFFDLPVRVTAVLVGVFILGVNYAGTRGSGRFQNIIVVFLVVLLSAFAVLGAFVFTPGNLIPVIPRGWGAVFGTAGIVFISFLGFDVIATVAEKIRSPGRNIPLAMLGSVVFVTLLYVVVILAAMGAVPLPEFTVSSTPMALAAERIVGALGAGIVALGAVLATVSSANASVIGASRVSFAMGRDGVMSRWVNEIHKRFLTPSRSIVLSGVIILGLVAVGRVDVLAEVASFTYLAIFVLVHVSLVVLRRSNP